MDEKQFLAGIGWHIRELRLKNNISQIELAALCNFEKASMSRIEAGKSNVTILTLRKISRALNVEITDLLKFKAY